MPAAPCGTWTSPVTARVVAAAATRLSGVTVDGDDIYWVEGRPAESGRSVIVKRGADGVIADATPPGTNARTRVHEYGGAAYAVSKATIYYTEFADQRVYELAPGGVPKPITPAGKWYYADAVLDPIRRRLVSVREDHTIDGSQAVTTLVGLELDGPANPGQVLVSGHDFYSNPRFSPDGSRLSWLAWRHPQMPWDGTELWMATLARDGSIERPRLVAGGDSESIFQPEWSPDGTLYFVSDRTGWWNLYRLREGVEPICPTEADFGRPLWQLGTSTWAFADHNRLVVSYVRKGRWHLATLDLATGTLAPLAHDIEPGEAVAATRTHAVLLAGTTSAPDAIVRVDLSTGGVETIRPASEARVDRRFFSTAEAIEFPTDPGPTAHAFYYPPVNPDFSPLAGERPPLIVISHGGPTAMSHARLNLEVQYWTSRGFALVDVNYGGSTGFGRAYRQRLRGQWGIVDVADCVNAARWLAARGLADAERVIIRGRSAGGYTTLAALTFHPSAFRAGASYYGIADLERLALDTHKFESRYLDGLVGPYPADRGTYRERSPIHFVDRLSCPIIFFQGLDDRVVPPNQSQLMADSVRHKGLPVALVTFAGEQHGFRRAENITRCLEAELFFYGAVFGFEPAGPRPELTIDNLAGC